MLDSSAIECRKSTVHEWPSCLTHMLLASLASVSLRLAKFEQKFNAPIRMLQFFSPSIACFETVKNINLTSLASSDAVFLVERYGANRFH